MMEPGSDRVEGEPRLSASLVRGRPKDARRVYDQRVMTLIETYHVVVVAASREVASALARAGLPAE